MSQASKEKSLSCPQDFHFISLRQLHLLCQQDYMDCQKMKTFVNIACSKKIDL